MSDDITLLFSGLPATANNFALAMTTVALVRSGGKLIMFDTGPYAYRPILQARMHHLRIDPSAVDMVVLSHLHWDNASTADLCGRAAIVGHEAELSESDGVSARDEAKPGYLVRALRKLRLRPVAGESELVPGLHIVAFPGHTAGSIGLRVGKQLLAGDAVSCARDAMLGECGSSARDQVQAGASLARALRMADIIYPGHDRPFRVGPPISYVDNYELRIRLFIDPAGQDEELRIGAAAARSFATWPSGPTSP